jgi:hypothetical protein
VGISIFLACTVGWFAAACAQYPRIWDDQVMHHFGRFQGELGGDKPPLFYVWSILLNTLPWSPLIVVGLIYGLKHGLLNDPIWRFAACWIAPGLCLLLVSTFQSKHYAAPLMPPLSIVGALAIAAYIRRRQRMSAWLHVTTTAFGLAICAAAALALPRWWPAGADVVTVLMLLLAAGLLLTNFFAFRRLTSPALAAVFATCWLLIAGVLSFVMPHYDSYRDQALLAARTNRIVPEKTALHLVRLPENQIAYYLSPHVERFDAPDEFVANIRVQDREIFVLAPESLREELVELGNVVVLDRCATVNRYLRESDRLTLMRVTPDAQRLAAVKKRRNR